jgi:hypothetical protein
MALQSGHANAVKAFIKVVLDSKLDDDQKHELLAAKRNNGTPGFYMALKNGHANVVKIFVKAVLDSKKGEHKILIVLFIIVVINSKSLSLEKKNELIPKECFNIFSEFFDKSPKSSSLEKFSETVIMLYTKAIFKDKISKETYKTYFKKRFVDDMLKKTAKLKKLNKCEYYFIMRNSKIFENIISDVKLSADELSTLSNRYLGATKKFNRFSMWFYKNPISNFLDNCISEALWKHNTYRQ